MTTSWQNAALSNNVDVSETTKNKRFDCFFVFSHSLCLCTMQDILTKSGNRNLNCAKSDEQIELVFEMEVTRGST